MNDHIPMEVYTLTLTHTFLTKDGMSCNIESPLVLQHCAPRFEHWGSSIIVDEMMDKMKHALLERIRERTMPTDWSQRDADV